MAFYTAQERTGVILIKNRAITLPGTDTLPFFWGNANSISTGLLVCSQIGVFYQLSFNELRYIKEAFQKNVSALIVAPETTSCDDWFIALSSNVIKVTKGIVLQSKTISVLLSFGGVMDEQGDFVFKSIAKATMATEYILANRKVTVSTTDTSKIKLSKYIAPSADLNGKTILFVNPSDFVKDDVEAISMTTMTDFVETEKVTTKSLSTKGAVSKARSLYHLSPKYKYDLVVFKCDCDDFNELVIRSIRHAKNEGKIFFFAPKNWRKVSSTFVTDVISKLCVLVKESDSHELILLDRENISKQELIALSKRAQ